MNLAAPTSDRRSDPARQVLSWPVPRWVVSPTLLALFLLVLGLFRGPTLDASVFIAVADFMNAGLTPYVDAFDHKPPGLYLALAGLGGLAPSIDPWHRAWLVTAVGTVGTIIALAWSEPADRRGLPAGVALIAAVPVLAGHFFALNGGYTESLAVLPVTAAFALMVGRRLDRPTLLAGGLLCGLALSVAVQALPAVMAIAISVAGGRTGWRRAVALACAAAAPIGLIVLWLVVDGAFGAAWSQIVLYNAEYGRANADGGPRSVVWLVASSFLVIPLLVASILRVLHWRRGARSQRETAAVWWLALWLVWVVLQRNYFPHYAILAAPALYVLAAGGLSQVLANPAGRGLRRIAGSLVVGFVLLGVFAGEMYPGLSQPAFVRQTAERISLLGPSTLFVWGNEPSIYTASSILPATKYIYFAPLLLSSAGTSGRIQEALDELVQRRPEVIVDASVNPNAIGSPPLFGDLDPQDAAGRALDPVRRFVRDNYQLVADVGPWKVYRLK